MHSSLFYHFHPGAATLSAHTTKQRSLKSVTTSMGIKGLAKLLSDEAPDCIREVELKSLHGRKIAIDASMAIYQFLIAVRSGGPNQQATMLTNADGETTSHIQGMFNRTIRFLSEG
jgi:flap endonuclease-1